MKNEIYEYLINYGFSKEILDRIEEFKEDLYFVSLDKVKSTYKSIPLQLGNKSNKLRYSKIVKGAKSRI